jgi:hypothetical protein
MKTLKELREESNGNIRMLWHHDYWDGPISGVILWNGEYCWFNQIEQVDIETPMSEEDKQEFINYCEKNGYKWYDSDLIDYESYRVYNVYRMPRAVMKAIIHNHSVFQEYVGTHTDYDEYGCRHHNLKSKDFMDAFYSGKVKKEKVDLRLEEREVVGVFKY